MSDTFATERRDEAGRETQGSARAADPISCQLLDDNGYAVMVLEDGVSSGHLRVVLRNNTDLEMTMNPRSGGGAAIITLHFRRGVLSGDTVTGLRAYQPDRMHPTGIDSEGWGMLPWSDDDTAVGVSISLFLHEKRRLGPGEVIEVALRGFKSNPKPGPRLTRVRITLEGIVYSDGTGALNGQHTVQLQLLDGIFTQEESSSMQAFFVEGGLLDAGRDDNRITIALEVPSDTFYIADGAAPSVVVRFPVEDTPLALCSRTSALKVIGWAQIDGYKTSAEPSNPQNKSDSLFSVLFDLSKNRASLIRTNRIYLTLRAIPGGYYASQPAGLSVRSGTPLNSFLEVHPVGLTVRPQQPLRLVIAHQPAAVPATAPPDLTAITARLDQTDNQIEGLRRSVLDGFEQSLEGLGEALSQQGQELKAFKAEMPDDLGGRLDRLTAAVARLAPTEEPTQQPSFTRHAMAHLILPDNSVLHTQVNKRRKRMIGFKTTQYQKMPGASAPFVETISSSADHGASKSYQFGGAALVAFSNMLDFKTLPSLDVPTYVDGAIPFGDLILPSGVVIPDGVLRVHARPASPQDTYDEKAARHFNTGIPHNDTQGATFDCAVTDGRMRLKCISGNSTLNITLHKTFYKRIHQIFHLDQGYLCLSFDGAVFTPGPVPKDF